MNQQELLQTIQRLRADLAGTPDLEDSTRQALRVLIADLEGIAARHETIAQPPAPPEDHSVGQQLRDAISDFEARHPTLTGTLSGFVDRLVDMGI